MIKTRDLKAELDNASETLQIDKTLLVRAKIASEIQRLFQRNLTDRTGLWADWKEPDYAKERALVVFQMGGKAVGGWLRKSEFAISTDGSYISRAACKPVSERGELYPDESYNISRWSVRRNALQPIDIPLDLSQVEPSAEPLSEQEHIVVADALTQVTRGAYIPLD